MIRQNFVCFILAFLLLFFAATVEQFSLFAGTNPQESVQQRGGDYAPVPSLAFAAKRLVRAKGPARASAGSYLARPSNDLGYWRSETSVPHASSKYDVYQQMNVYRL